MNATKFACDEVGEHHVFRAKTVGERGRREIALDATEQLAKIGDVLRDQLFYMQRVGFNAFAVRTDKDIHDAAKSLNDFSETYQGASDQPVPLFRRRPTMVSAA